MERVFEIRTEPHVAKLGDVSLYLFPEVEGAAFAAAYAGLREAQKSITAAGDNVGPDELAAVNKGMRDFLSSFMTDESRATFTEMKLPDRVLVQLLEFAAELYGGGGQGNDRGGLSSDS